MRNPDARMDPAGLGGKLIITTPIVTAVSQADLKADAATPGAGFIITKVQVFASAVTATISVDVKKGTTSVLTGPVTPVAGTDTAGTLVSNRATLIGTASDTINVHYTTNGTGAATNLRVRVWIRGYPGYGEIL